MKKKNRIAVVVLPTYNEKGNIEKVLNAILKQNAHLDGVSLSILVVDDSSPDGTGRIVERFRKNHTNVYLLSGKKQGLGSAYIRGFLYAIDVLKADIIFQMDADFSHNPSDIPRFIDEILNGYDFVIGSRYITGGSIPSNWSWLRKLNSKWGNIFARHIAGMKDVRDCTSGYRAIRTEVLKKIEFNNLGVTGYAMLMNLLYQAVNHNARIREIPIHFTERTQGKSKLRLTDVVEFIINAFYIRSRLLKRKIAI